MIPSPEMFNDIAANPIYKFNEVIEKLSIKSGDIIADIGSGGGYYAFKFAQLVGSSGKIFAIDIRPYFLEYIRKHAKNENIDNIKTILSIDDQFILSNNGVDLVFMRNVCHHLENRVSYFKKIAPYLKSNGKIVIIDYTPEGNRQGHGPPGHFVDPKDLIEELKHAGFQPKEKLNFLPGQFFIIFN